MKSSRSISMPSCESLRNIAPSCARRPTASLSSLAAWQHENNTATQVHQTALARTNTECRSVICRRVDTSVPSYTQANSASPSLCGRRSEYWWLSWPTLGKKHWVLSNSRSWYQDCCHTDLVGQRRWLLTQPTIQLMSVVCWLNWVKPSLTHKVPRRDEALPCNRPRCLCEIFFFFLSLAFNEWQVSFAHVLRWETMKMINAIDKRYATTRPFMYKNTK